MGVIFSSAPVSSRFVIGLGVGYGCVYYMPDEYFKWIRPNLFLIVENAQVTINPKEHQRKSESPTLKKLKELQETEDKKKYERDYLEMRQSYKQRVVDYADEDELIDRKSKERSEGPERLHDTIVEYEAIKRLEKKNIERKT